MWVVVIIIIVVIYVIKEYFSMEKEDTMQTPVLSPLEKALEEIKSGAFGRAKKIAMYVVSLYSKPYVEMGGDWSCTSIETIVSKYLNNQLLFSEEYENHVIALEGTVETIGKIDGTVYLSIGDGEYCHISGTSGENVKRLIECYLDKKDMEDIEFKNIIMNMKPGAEVTLVGVLKKGKYGSFKLHGTTLIEVDDVVPDRIMRMAKHAIYKEYESENK